MGEVELTCNYPATFVEIDDSVKSQKDKIAESMVKAKKKAGEAKKKVTDKIKKATGLDVDSIGKLAVDTISGADGLEFVDAEQEGSFEWVKQSDPSTGNTYYYNLETKVSLWEPPPEWDEAKGKRRLKELNEEKA